jgi:D-glycero-alpha-D-manno-heptose-7-phosphate kinase
MPPRPKRIPKGFEPFSVIAPNRVDLAGGTLDIFPLYLLVRDALTVNAAIDVASRVTIWRAEGGARLLSDNYRVEEEAVDTHGFAVDGKLGLFARALRCFPPCAGISIRLANEAPVGSGLGASSALLVAAMLAMDRIGGNARPWDETSRIAMEVEAAHLRNLAGRQDHIAALRGGIQGIRFLPGTIEAERLSPGSRAGRLLARHGFLASTGKAHHSAGVNWRMIRGAIGGDAGLLSRFEAISQAGHAAWAAIRAGDAAAAGDAIAREWSVRRTLARGVSTPLVDRLFARPAFVERVSGAKLCGAGGGGMIFGLLGKPEYRGAVEGLLEEAGCDLFPFRLSDGPRIESAAGGGSFGDQLLPIVG